MSRRMLMMAMALSTAIAATTSYAARLVQAPQSVFRDVFQPPERPEPPRPPERPEPPQPPRGEGREQAPRAMVGGGIQMTASGKFVYILRGDEILQFEATTLEFVKKIKLPPPERPNRREGERGDRQPPRNDDRPPPPPEE
jgi:hypothetical protein